MNTDKKKQHYIPKFYLRNFSFQKNEKQIGIYHLTTKRFFPKATLKDQGTKNFFYGEDGQIEDSLSEIEGSLATQIKQINQTAVLPPKDTESHELLLSFVGLTHLRNPIVINYAKESRNKLKAQLLELNPKLDTSQLGLDMDHQDAVAIALSSLPDVVGVMGDLQYKLIVNNTKQPFITSDFPVVKYNQFLESKKWPHGKTAYGNLGLQIFIPLNPSTMVMFYDSAIYKVGFKKQNIIYVDHKQDIDQLNILQAVNCFETLFFNDLTTEHYLEQLNLTALKFPKANQTLIEMQHAVKGNNRTLILPSNNAPKNLMMMGTTDCETKLTLSFVKLISGVNNIAFDNRIVRLRPAAEKIVASGYRR